MSGLPVPADAPRTGDPLSAAGAGPHLSRPSSRHSAAGRRGDGRDPMDNCHLREAEKCHLDEADNPREQGGIP